MTDPLIEKILQLRLAASQPTRTRAARRLIPPVSEEAITEAESRLGFPLPDFLRQLYLLVGNGGFGPYCGLAGLDGGASLGPPWCGCGGSIVDAFLENREWEPDSALLVVCDWGCLMGSGIDCSTPDGEMVFIDEDDEKIREGIGFRQWMQDWVDGVDVFERARKRRVREEPEL